MPYIDRSLKKNLLAERVDTVGEQCNSPGELNFVLTAVALGYLGYWVSDGSAPSGVRAGWGYKELNELIGVLECVKQEFYRRTVVPYEEDKIEENGDVYPKESGDVYP